MKGAIFKISLLVILVVNGVNATTVSEKCQKFTEFGTRALEVLTKTYPKEKLNQKKMMLEAALRVDITSAADRQKILCPIADATNIRELYEAVKVLPFLPDFKLFKALYHELVKDVVEELDGYTNINRAISLKFDMQEWYQQLKNGTTLKEMTDLDSLVDFFKKMQVKYGSRWLSLPLGIRFHDFLIEDPEDFAKKLFECTTEEDVEKFSDLEDYKARKLLEKMTGNVRPPMHKEVAILYAEAINLIGDAGLFYLQ